MDVHFLNSLAIFLNMILCFLVKVCYKIISCFFEGQMMNDYLYYGIKVLCALALLTLVEFAIWYRTRQLIDILNIELSNEKEGKVRCLVYSLVGILFVGSNLFFSPLSF